MMTSMNVEPILKKYPRATRDILIPILQEVQEVHGYLSLDAAIRIGQHLSLPTSKIYGVATFYNQFRFQAPGRYQVQVCRGTACHVKGSFSILETVRHELKVEPGQTTRDGLFSLEVVACLGACGLAPTICINGEFYASLTPDKARRIVHAYRQEAMSQVRPA